MKFDQRIKLIDDVLEVAEMKFIKRTTTLALWDWENAGSNTKSIIIKKDVSRKIDNFGSRKNIMDYALIKAKRMIEKEISGHLELLG